MSRLRIGIVGVGRHGSRYARHAARDVDGMELAAICRRGEKEGGALAAELGCDFTPDALELIARPDIDAVVLVTVPDLLENFVSAAAAEGKALLVEKPVAPDPATGQRILSRINDAGLYCLAGHTLRFNTVCLAIREMIPSLGRLDSMTFSQAFPPQLQLDWLDEPERSGGGNILHTGVHCFDLINFFTGMVPSSAFCRTRSIYTSRTEDCFTASLSFEGAGTLAQVGCARSTAGRNGLIEVVGENGHIVADHAHNTLYRIGPDGRHEVQIGAPKMTVLEALRQLRSDLVRQAEPAIGYRDGLCAVAVADACYRSSRCGSTAEVETPAFAFSSNSR